jgi:hypothetical protein
MNFSNSKADSSRNNMSITNVSSSRDAAYNS